MAVTKILKDTDGNMVEILALDAGAGGLEEAPETIRLIPKGHVDSQKGDFFVDDESFNLIQRHFKGRKLDLVIDYEHQTLKDVQAPAAGWIKELINGPDAIMAKVEWTKKGAEYLKNREYRYLSPVILTRKTDKKVVALHSAALTNTPAIDGMYPIACSLLPEDIKEETIMELAKLIKLLGLPEDATEADVEAALQAAGGAAAQENQQDATEGTAAVAAKGPAADPIILSMLGLKGSVGTDEVAAAIMQLKNGGDSTLALEVKELKERMAQKDAEEAVIQALKTGKISASMKGWAKEYALKDPEGFQAFVDKAPKTVPMGMISETDTKPDTVLQEDLNLAVLKTMGLTEEDIKKYYLEETK